MIELTCAEVVPLIAQSGPRLDLVISRRPADSEFDDCHTSGSGNHSTGAEIHPSGAGIHQTGGGNHPNGSGNHPSGAGIHPSGAGVAPTTAARPFDALVDEPAVVGDLADRRKLKEDDV